MRKFGWLMALLLAFLPAAVRGQETPPKPQEKQESLAEAARKAREKKKSAPKADKVFTNDNLPTSPSSAVSVVGSARPVGPPAEGAAPAAEGAAQARPEGEEEDTEEAWRQRFAEAREKLGLAERELSILQRELNDLMVQYEADPNEALKQQFSRDKINEHNAKIQAKQAEIAQLRQALTALQDGLRRKGLPSGWGREP